MKISKYIFFAALGLLLASCQKNVIEYDSRPLESKGYDAEFQLHYFEPVTSTAANYIDSVFVNDVLYSSVDGSGQLLTYNGVPGGGIARFFAAKSGSNRITLWRDGAVVYDKNANLKPGKQNIFIYDLAQEPKIIESGYPYRDVVSRPDPTAETFDTDSIAVVRFYNFLFEADGTPYAGKLQYQWRNDVKDAEGNYIWHNVGAPVAFGEASEYTPLTVHKVVFNHSGYQRIDYRILDESGKVLRLNNSKGTEIDYSDWWNAYIGRVYMHIFAGYRKDKPSASVRVWTCM